MTINEWIESADDIWSGSPWYGKAVKELLNRVQYDSTPIYNIANHMMAWRKFALDKVNGINTKIEMDSPEDWPSDIHQDIRGCIEWMETNLNEIKNVVASKEDDWLNETVIGENYDYSFLLQGILQHDIYHIGQIVLLLKLGM